MAAESAPPDLGGHQGHPLKWSQIGSTAQDLQSSMETLYWTGVQADVLNIICTLRSWREVEYSQVLLKEDQLCLGSKVPFSELGLRTFLDRATSFGGREIEDSIRSTMHTTALRGSYPHFERITHTLLQAAGFLDIDKLVEYRPPLKDFEIWTRPRAPQLVPLKDEFPSFALLRCTFCSNVLRGSHFRCFRGCTSSSNTTQLKSDPYLPPSQHTHDMVVLCETCARMNVHERSHLRKCQKNCVVGNAVGPLQGRELCHCTSRRLRTDSLFPFTYVQRSLHGPECELLEVMPKHIRARKSDILGNNLRSSLVSSSAAFDERIEQRSPRSTISGRSTRTKAFANQLLKPLIRPILDKIPFGNVHVGLMFGPIIIENGVPESNSGARISIRDPLALASWNRPSEKQKTILSLSPDRIIYHSQTATTNPRRVKAYMKQVVGGAFCEIRDVSLEHELIKALARESQNCVYEPMKRQQYDDEKLESATTRIVQMLRRLLEGKVKLYLETIVRRLFDPLIPLKWDIRTNHCQKFCDSLLDYEVFGSFMATKEGCHECPPSDPLYLVSFLCQPGSYLPTMVRPKSKKMAPNGLTEEYLFRFYNHGNHDDSDIIDTLMNYWHDWGAFGRTLFPHQKLFPWDCTEACRMGHEDGELGIKCNKCSIMKHVWAFPFDSWSLVRLHISRDRTFYEPETHGEGALSDVDWMQNRLDVLDSLQALNAIAVAIVQATDFRKSCRWVNLSGQSNVRERDPKNTKKSLKRDRAKLAGIFRAQPKSHYFEQGKYHDCTIAPWGDLVREDQIMLYTTLRDFRADQLLDVKDLYKKPASIAKRSSPDPSDPVIPTTSKAKENKTDKATFRDYGRAQTNFEIEVADPDFYSGSDRARMLPAMEYVLHTQDGDFDNEDGSPPRDDLPPTRLPWTPDSDVSWLWEMTAANENALWSVPSIDFDHSVPDEGATESIYDSEDDEDDSNASAISTQGTISNVCKCAVKQKAEEQSLVRAAELENLQLAQLKSQRAAFKQSNEPITRPPRVSSLRRLKNKFKSLMTNDEEKCKTHFRQTPAETSIPRAQNFLNSSTLYTAQPRFEAAPQMLLN